MRPVTVSDGFRPDIQALRALAVAGVVVFHLFPGLLPGGYVGVDVFFVISGYLITGHLLREREKTGTIHVGRFWARRARRLLPASLLVLLVCAIATVTLMPAALRLQNLREVAAAALYSENWRLALDAIDYLAEGNGSSLVRHFWSLSTEEQFYLVVPLLLMATFALARRRSPARATVVVLGLVIAASLAHSVLLTTSSPGVAYFSTFTRAWEFAAGGLLAALALRTSRAAAAGAWAGVAMIVVAYVAFSGQTAFPGYAALLPVVGTVLALWGGPATLVARIGAWAPVALVGRVSYAIYLWHWPPIILLPHLTGHPLTVLEKLLIGLVTLLVAWLSTTYVEEPVRFAPQLRGSRAVALASAVAVAAVAVFAHGAAVAQRSHDAKLVAAAAAYWKNPPRCLGAQARDPEKAPCENPDLDGVLVPEPAVAVDDDANRLPCWGVDGRAARICTVVQPKGYTRTLLVAGDSHSNTLLDVYDRIGRAHGWRVMAAGLGGCYLTAGHQLQPSEMHAERCEDWKSSVIRWARDNDVAGVVVTHSAGDRRLDVPPSRLQQATVDGLVEAWNQLPDVPIVAIVDNPKVPADTKVCVDRDRATANERCSVPRAAAFRQFDGQREAVKRVPRATLVDFSDFYCDEDSCPVVIGNVLVYRDASHVTRTWAATLAPYVDKAVGRALP